MLLFFALITISSILSLIIFKKTKVIFTLKKLAASYKIYFLNLRKFSKNKITIKKFLVSLREIIYLTLILIFKVILIITPFLTIYIL